MRLVPEMRALVPEMRARIPELRARIPEMRTLACTSVNPVNRL